MTSTLHQTTAHQSSHGCTRYVPALFLLRPESDLVTVKTAAGTTTTFRDALEVKIRKGQVRYVRDNQYGTIYEEVLSPPKDWTVTQLLGICDELVLTHGGVFHDLKRSAVRLLEAGQYNAARMLLEGNAVIQMRVRRVV